MDTGAGLDSVRGAWQLCFVDRQAVMLRERERERDGGRERGNTEQQQQLRPLSVTDQEEEKRPGLIPGPKHDGCCTG